MGNLVLTTILIPYVQAFAELLEVEDINVPAWLSFNSKDGVNVVSGDSLSECAAIAESCKKIVAVGINCTPPRFIQDLILSIKKVLFSLFVTSLLLFYFLVFSCPLCVPFILLCPRPPSVTLSYAAKMELRGCILGENMFLLLFSATYLLRLKGRICQAPPTFLASNNCIFLFLPFCNPCTLTITQYAALKSW